MITLEQAMRLHQRSIADYGGSPGVRDEAGLLAAPGRPYATFGGELLYKDAFEQAAAIGESIIMNHPFVDGNKRTGFALMMRVLDEADLWIHAPSGEVYQFVIDLATGEKRFEHFSMSRLAVGRCPTLKDGALSGLRPAQPRRGVFLQRGATPLETAARQYEMHSTFASLRHLCALA